MMNWYASFDVYILFFDGESKTMYLLHNAIQKYS